MKDIQPGDLRLIETGFPCHQVGAETQRERGASSALPPLYFLHVWWARRPLTPSRAAILASLLPADTDPDWFLMQLGIKKRVVEINGREWVLSGKAIDKIKRDKSGNQFIRIDAPLRKLIEKENIIRGEIRGFLQSCQRTSNLSAIHGEKIDRWNNEVEPLTIPVVGETLRIIEISGDPAWAKAKQELGKAAGYRFPGDAYGYCRAFENTNNVFPGKSEITVLDPTAGGGSIPFEALRLGYNVLANELNPVASVILHATLEFPMKYGPLFKKEISKWGKTLLERVDKKLNGIFPDHQILPRSERISLEKHLEKAPERVSNFNNEFIVDYLYCRQVTCPSCGGDVPLLNTCWLSKEAGKQWGARIVTDGKDRNGKVHFETYRIEKGKKAGGEDPNAATVKRGVGMCVHCRQAIDAEEIKRQARGESALGKWRDRLYCVVAVRLQPKLDKSGRPLRYKSGAKKGQIKTEKVRFFRPPNETDLKALKEAEKQLQDNWGRWDAQGLIPTETIPLAHKTKEPLRVGMKRWCDMFTPRQLLGHVTLVEELNRLKPEIIDALGKEKGRAVVTYLQFAIDKCLDYNSRQTLWHASRGVVAHTFTRHDFSLKWTFGELILTGPNSGFGWGLNQVLDAYQSISELIFLDGNPNIQIPFGTAAHLPLIDDNSVDLICIDPPYYNNVQYAELSDYFYVWQKRTLSTVFPKYFKRRMTDKQNEAVANPDRDGGTKKAKDVYEKRMAEIFSECARVLKPQGIMTVMFNHKSQEAWEALTESLISNKWIISSAFPVESESSIDIHHKEMAATVSSVFLACRKCMGETSEPAFWTGIGGTGVAKQIREAVTQGLKDFQALKLNPIDEMVASYGRALRVLSQNWPVLDGDEPVGPIRVMNEASRVVAENQIRRMTNGRVNIKDLSPEAAMALTLYGIYGLAEFPFDEALNLSRSLNIRLESKSGGYTAEGRFIGVNAAAAGGRRAAGAVAETVGFHAPLVRKGSKMRLARPGERHAKRLESPQTEWDVLHGVIMEYRKGDVPVARAYLARHARGNEDFFKNLLYVWAAEMADERLRKEADMLAFGLQ